jgi:hypothetical protein
MRAGVAAGRSTRVPLRAGPAAIFPRLNRSYLFGFVSLIALGQVGGVTAPAAPGR